MKVIVIAGPTGVGKTRIAYQLAKEIDGEIINADSTQVYVGMEIATAKEISFDIPHHLFNICQWDEEYNAYQYQQDCRKKISEIIERGKTPILVGGTGLYIKAALYDYQFGVENEDFANLSNQEILNEIKKYDLNTKIDVNNRQRLVSNLKHFLQEKKDDKDKLLYDACLIGLTMHREKLYEQINQRVDLMVEQGLLDEAKKIYDSNIRTKAVLTPIGYPELFAYFAGEINLEEAVWQIKKRSRNYAKRQFTWFKNQMDLNWFEVDENVFFKILNYLAENSDKS